MNRLVSPFLKLMLGISLLFVVFSAPAAAANKIPVNLRVVTYSGKILFDGQVKTGTTSIKPNTECLGGSPGPARTITGPSALGALKDASALSASLRPFKISDGTYGFGICGLGTTVAKGTNWWALKYQHELTTTGAEVTKLKKNGNVLFYLAEDYNVIGTPAELALEAPAKAKKGSTVKVRVVSYDDKGKRKPVEGAKLSVGGALTDAKGYTKVKVSKKTSLIARFAGTIPSNRAVIKIKK